MEDVAVNPQDLHTLHEAQAENRELREQLRELRLQLDSLTPTPAPTPAPAPMPQPTPVLLPQPIHWQEPSTMVARLPAVAPPPLFSGERDRLEDFLDRCRHIFLTSPAAFAQEPQKVLYASVYLAGPVYTWFRPILRAYEASRAPNSQTPTPPEFLSFHAFSQTLMSMYGDPDLEGTMFEELLVLTQTTTAAAYAAEFRRIIAYIPWPPECFMTFFKKGLRPSVKNLIVGDNLRATTLDELVAQAIKWDNRIIEDMARKRSSAPTWRNSNPVVAPRAPWQRPTTTAQHLAPPLPRNFPPTRPPPAQYPPATRHPVASTANNFPSDGSTPMELDQTRRFPYPVLSEEEKAARRQYRSENNLCTYCGEAGHRVPECPRSPANREALRLATYAATSRFTLERPAQTEPAKDNVQE
jgi:Retrotransposon gag protein